MTTFSKVIQRDQAAHSTTVLVFRTPELRKVKRPKGPSLGVPAREGCGGTLLKAGLLVKEALRS